MKTRSKINGSRVLLPLLAAALLTIISWSQAGKNDQSESPYKPEWTSLQQHDTPRWLKDAKFGIYTHWGLQTIQYMPEHEGKSLEERIELFNPEKFDPADWAMLFREAGARFAGPVAWHGSDYIHWKSKYTDFNSYDRNPGIDIVAELEREIRKQGMKFFMSYHSIGDRDSWIRLAKEGVDRFSPDVFWVDASFGGTKAGHHLKVLDNSRYIGENTEFPRMLQEKYQLEFLSYFYNDAWRNGREVEFVYKSFDIPPGVGMRDLENGLLNQLAYNTWMTDMDMNVPPDWATHGWFYREGIPLRDANALIDMLMDVISKNGIFLLNIPPKADGSIPEEVRSTLLQVGDWLKVNGEAVYGSHPWFIYGEGPQRIDVGNYTFHHNNHFGQIRFDENDIRFTVNGQFLYATCLGNPGEELSIRSLNNQFKLKENEIVSVELLGSGSSLSWEHTQDALVIGLPEVLPSDHALVFRITRDMNL